MNVTGRHIAGLGGALALAGLLITGFESPHGHAVLRVYPDPATHSAPWTACDGETAGMHPGMVFTTAQCDAMTAAGVTRTDAAVMQCVGRPLPDAVRASFDSLAWNIGTGNFCKSSVAAKAKSGDLAGACNRIPAFDMAAGRVMPGLASRRGTEREICLGGIK